MKKYTIIPGVRGFKELEKAFSAPSDTLFLLEGEIIHLRHMVESIRQTKKKVFLHLDLIKGIKEDEASIHYLAKDIQIDGVISTRTSTLLYAKKHGLKTVQRGFLIDSHSLKTIIKTAETGKPDYIELMPSFSYSKLQEIKDATGAKIIMGGFIDRAEDLPRLFDAGATAVSTSKMELWTYSHSDNEK